MIEIGSNKVEAKQRQQSLAGKDRLSVHRRFTFHERRFTPFSCGLQPLASGLPKTINKAKSVGQVTKMRRSGAVWGRIFVKANPICFAEKSW